MQSSAKDASHPLRHGLLKLVVEETLVDATFPRQRLRKRTRARRHTLNTHAQLILDHIRFFLKAEARTLTLSQKRSRSSRQAK